MNTKNISTLVQLRKKNLLHKMYYSISLHNYRRVKSDNNTYIILNLIKIKNLFFNRNRTYVKNDFMPDYNFSLILACY